MAAPPVVDRRLALAFRARGHHLDERLPAGDTSVVTAARACGLRSAMGSALLSLAARVDGVRESCVDDALARGLLVDVVGPRGADVLVPADPDEVAVFTVGSLPRDEASLRARLKPFLPGLEASGHSAVEALSIAVDVARDALSDGPVGIGALSGALTRALPELSPMCRGRCRVAHIEGLLFDLVGESGVWHHVRADDGTRLFAPMAAGGLSPSDARAELVRRYVGSYGPAAVPGHFAEWCGIGVADARASLAGAEVPAVDVGVDSGGGVRAARGARGVRVVPPRDPYLLDRDRPTLVEDREVQKRIWRSTPTDGIVLVDGEPAATWRPKKSQDTLVLNVSPFLQMSKRALSELDAEAAGVARLRGCARAEVRVAA